MTHQVSASMITTTVKHEPPHRQNTVQGALWFAARFPKKVHATNFIVTETDGVDPQRGKRMYAGIFRRAHMAQTHTYFCGRTVADRGYLARHDD